MNQIRERFAAPCLTTLLLAASAFAALAAPASDSGRVTQLVNDVTVQSAHTPSRVVSLSELISAGSTTRTAADSRLELTFANGLLVRLGPTSTLQNEGDAHFEFAGGALLLHLPRNSEPAQVQTPLVSIATTGATFTLETHHFLAARNGTTPSLPSDARYRLNVLEGAVQVCLTGSTCVTVQAHQALIGGTDKPLGTVVKFDTADFLQSDLLITGFQPLSASILALIGAPASHSLTAFLRPIGTAAAGELGSTSLGTINPANLSNRGNEVSPSEERLTICHNGQTLTLPRNAAEKHLRNHPGDTVGACR